MARSAKENNIIATFKRIEKNEESYTRLREDIDEKSGNGVICVKYYNLNVNKHFPCKNTEPEGLYFFLKNHPLYVRDLEQDGYAVEFNYQSDGEIFDNVTISWGDA